MLLPETSEQQPRTGFGVAVPMSEPFGQYPHGQYSYGPGGAYPVPEPPRRHRARHALGLTATAVVAAALGAGAAVGLAGGSSTRRRGGGDLQVGAVDLPDRQQDRPRPGRRDLDPRLPAGHRQGHRHRADLQRRDPHQQPRDQRRHLGVGDRHRQRQDLQGDRRRLRREQGRRRPAADRRVRPDRGQPGRLEHRRGGQLGGRARQRRGPRRHPVGRDRVGHRARPVDHRLGRILSNL